MTVADTKTSDTDVVTEADRASETLIRRLLRERRPDDAFLGEEGDDEAGTSGVRWVVDPIDGTVNFLYGLPAYAVSIAAERRRRRGGRRGPQRGHGHRVRRPPRPDGAAGGASPPATASRSASRPGAAVPAAGRHRVQLRRPGARAPGRAMVRLLPRIRDIRRIGSSALDLCHVAEGAVDAYVEEGVNYWDHAAGGPWWPGSQGPAPRAAPRASGGHDLMICAPGPRLRRVPRGRPRCGVSRGHPDRCRRE